MRGTACIDRFDAFDRKIARVEHERSCRGVFPVECELGRTGELTPVEVDRKIERDGADDDLVDLGVAMDVARQHSSRRGDRRHREQSGFEHA